jgi:hypothetical protein
VCVCVCVCACACVCMYTHTHTHTHTHMYIYIFYRSFQMERRTGRVWYRLGMYLSSVPRTLCPTNTLSYGVVFCPTNTLSHEHSVPRTLCPMELSSVSRTLCLIQVGDVLKQVTHCPTNTLSHEHTDTGWGCTKTSQRGRYKGPCVHRGAMPKPWTLNPKP